MQVGYVLKQRNVLRYFYPGYNSYVLKYGQYVRDRKAVMRVIEKVRLQFPNIIERLTREGGASNCTFERFTNIKYVFTRPPKKSEEQQE